MMRFAWVGLIVALHACASARTITSKDRSTARIHYDMGIEAFNKADMRGALRELLRSVERDPEFPQTHAALGLIYHAMGHFEEAAEHYERAVELKPSFSEAHNNRGSLLIDMGRYTEAIESFRKALADILYASPSLAEGNMGWAYYKNGQVDEALKHLRNATAMNPKFCRGYEWLARIGLDTGKAEEVVSSGKRFKKFCLDDAEIAKTIPSSYVHQIEYYWALGYIKQGDHSEARKLLASCAESESEKLSADCKRSLASMGHGVN